MPVKESYDFLQWTSFPSSLKVDNDTGKSANVTRKEAVDLYFVPVTTPARIRLECNIKTQNAVVDQPAWVAIQGYDAKGNPVTGAHFTSSFAYYPDWVKSSAEYDMPAGVVLLAVRLVAAGSGVAGKMATTWFDDLKIYQDENSSTTTTSQPLDRAKLFQSSGLRQKG